jgi:hypothetical protein
MGLCRLPRTVCERVGERWRDGAGSLLILGYPVIPMLAHMLARAVDAVDFRQSRNGDGTVPAAAHSLRACRGAMARRRRQFADLGLSGHTNACTCQWWRAWSMQSIIDCRKAVPLLREHVGESWCGGTDCLLTSGIRSYRGLHACSLGKLTGPIFDCREAEVGLCPWPRTVCESVGERWSDEAGCLLTSGIWSFRGLHASLSLLVDVTDFRLSRNGVARIEPVDTAT